MKFNIPSQSFSEVSQKAPLRWALCYREDATTFTGQHGWWKCKDFLNDTVVYLATGKEFSIYGYKNVAKINEEGGWVALKNVPEFFEHNLAILNEWLLDRGFTPIDYLHISGGAVEHAIMIPREYWGNTFFISVITSLIRACVYEKGDDLEKFVFNEPTLMEYWHQVKALLKPEHTEYFNKLLFVNYQYDSSNHPASYDTHVYHNAGLQSWINSRYQQLLKEVEECSIA